MKLKKLVAISDHYCSSHRTKVVFVYWLGFVSIFILLCILFSCYSFKNHTPEKLFYFQGFNTSKDRIFIQNSTQLVLNPKNLVSENRAESNDSNLDVRLKLLGIDAKGDTQLGNFTDNLKNESFNQIHAKVEYSKDTNLIKLKDDVKNGTFGTMNPNEGKVANFQEISNGSIKSDGFDQDHGKSSQILRNFSSSFEDCDIFNGRWVRDDSKPYYPAGSCPYVDRDFNCYLNKRPDDEFVKWRWQPFGCEIPR